ncbi:uncharacterized protein PAE49_023414 isoform 2-T2 [Odontesthes bonariensis]|uniref:uncharacterized protein LOC142370793 isoform X2 n=1 Tax=Odontesthes bonariensis TaxID=219752 RepID=UPI003F582B62
MFASGTPLFALLLLITDGGSSAEPIYKKEGDEVVISPGPVAAPITSIEWKHQNNIASEWSGGQTVCYREFNGRCQLNKTTGELIITGLLKNNSGSYTAEINYKVLRTTEVLVISAVPTPTITTRCSAENTDCVLTCEGNTEGAEPANYEWMSGDGRLGSDKELNITKEQKNEWFRCRLGNPVSSQTSEQVLNPFSTSPPNRHYYATLGTFIPLILLVCVMILLFIAYHKRSKASPTGTSNEDEPSEMEKLNRPITEKHTSPVLIHAPPSGPITEVGDSHEETGVQDAPSEEPTISRSEESDHRRDEEEAETIPPTQQSEISSSENKEDEKSENQEAAESVTAPSNSQQGAPGPDGKEGQRRNRGEVGDSHEEKGVQDVPPEEPTISEPSRSEQDDSEDNKDEGEGKINITSPEASETSNS